MNFGQINIINKVHQQSKTLLMRPVNIINIGKYFVDDFVDGKNVIKSREKGYNQQNQQSFTLVGKNRVIRQIEKNIRRLIAHVRAYIGIF